MMCAFVRVKKKLETGEEAKTESERIEEIERKIKQT